MKASIGFVVLCVTLTVSGASALAQENIDNKSEFPVLTGPYLGQTPPGTTAVLFAPGIISTELTEWTVAFMPDGNEGYFTIRGLENYNHLVGIREVDGVWQAPELASFTTVDHHSDPFITADGQKMFFWSNRPPKEGEEPTDNSDIWMAERVNDGWGEPVRLDTVINTGHWQIFPTVSSKGNLFFSCNYDDSKGSFDIYFSQYKDGRYMKPVNLGDSINTVETEQEPFIAADESYIIFCSDRHAPKTTNWDLYISFKRENGVWSEAINMGDKINSDAMDQAAIVTPDQKYIFFSSQRTEAREHLKKNFSYNTIVELLSSYQNGNSDVYWIDVEIIEQLRPGDLKQ